MLTWFILLALEVFLRTGPYKFWIPCPEVFQAIIDPIETTFWTLLIALKTHTLVYFVKISFIIIQPITF